jgi:hypothetical protein
MRRFTMTEVTETTTPVAATGNLVSFTDESGVVTSLDFGKKGLMKVDTVVSDTAIDQTYWLVTGIVKKLHFTRQIVQEASNALTDSMIIRGLKEFVGNSVAGVYSDKDGLHPEDFNLGIEQAIAALESGVIPTREKADKAAKGLGDLIRAYTELRAEAKDGEGNHRFTAEESSYDVVKALILGSTEEENKVRAGRANVKAKIEAYKAERAIGRAKAAGAQVAVADDADLV